MRSFAPVLLRIGMSLIFIWFGISQITSQTNWVDYVPSAITIAFNVSAATLVMANGIFEILFGSALLLGFFTRWTAFFLALHMFDIVYIVGFDATGVRDFGIAIGTATVWLFGSDWFSLDRLRLATTITTKKEAPTLDVNGNQEIII